MPPEVEELLKDLRRYIAESKDDWEKRRELLDRINAVLPGGEMEMFIAAVRGRSRSCQARTAIPVIKIPL